MQKSLAFFLILIGNLLFSCGPKLSVDEAKKVITEHLKYPKPVYTLINAPNDSKAVQGIHKLISDGFVKHSVVNWLGAQLDDYSPTDKGKPYIKAIDFNRFWGYYTFSGAVCNEVLKGIKEILLDKQNNVAVVTFVTGLEPIQPFYSLVCVDNGCSYSGEKINETKIHKIRLKKYDKGWRIED